MRDGLRRLIGRLEEDGLAAVLMTIVALNATNVFCRYVLGRSIGQLFELMVLLSMVVYWLGIGYAQRKNGHLGMDMLVARLGPGARRWTGRARLGVSFAFLLAIAYSAASQFQSGAVSGSLDLKLWWFSVLIPAGALIMAWRFLWPSQADRTPSSGDSQA
jgi:TRAP-type C4-dicarboxylate transport system permease small subunit